MSKLTDEELWDLLMLLLDDCDDGTAYGDYKALHQWLKVAMTWEKKNSGSPAPDVQEGMR